LVGSYGWIGVFAMFNGMIMTGVSRIVIGIEPNLLVSELLMWNQPWLWSLTGLVVILRSSFMCKIAMVFALFQNCHGYQWWDAEFPSNLNFELRFLAGPMC